MVGGGRSGREVWEGGKGVGTILFFASLHHLTWKGRKEGRGRERGRERERERKREGEGIREQVQVVAKEFCGLL